MQQMALATGRSADAAKYAAEFDRIKAAFQKAYVRADGFVGSIDHYPSIPPPTVKPEAGSSDKDHIVETQTGYVLALHMNLLPVEFRAAAANRLIQKIEQNHWLLGTGFLGTPYLLEVLADSGHAEVAYRLLLNRQYPSWGYLVDHGATTTWERWNGDQMRDDPSMNSYNHYAYGAVAEWMYRYGAGIDTSSTQPGFRSIVLHPNFDVRLGHMSLDYDSTYGTIHSGWTVTGKDVTWHVTVPANATAILKLDATNATAFMLDGVPLAKDPRVHSNGGEEVQFGAGTYCFKAVLSSARDGAAAVGR
jgi:alpha-L-rhamnosidase